MKITRNLRSSLLRSERKETIPSTRHRRVWPYAPIAAVFIVLLARSSTTFAETATWIGGNPECSYCWEYDDNWIPPTDPSGPAFIATFGTSNITNPIISINGVEANSIVFNSGASAFTIEVVPGEDFPVSLTISGAGVTNNSGLTQNFVVAPSFAEPGLESDITFTNSATAGELTVFTVADNPSGPPVSLKFNDDSTADGARVEVIGNGNLDISGHNTPSVTIGSVEGSGLVFLGTNNLTVGSNNISTTFSGVIQDSGSFTKIGRGTLTFTGANTYTGGTTVEQGTLAVNNLSGSATGTGAVQVNAGVLGGRGIIGGDVTVGTGSGRRAGLDSGTPGSDPGHFLSILGALTLNSDATCTIGLKTRNQTVDQVVANGITINGARFNFTVHGQHVLSPGTVFTVLENTAATPIAGNFINLPDASLITANGNTFRASYEGGDWNDLTLTVVP